jgi:hypothetical protein
MYFFHTLQNLEKYFKNLEKCKEYRQLKRDIHHLQTCKDVPTFEKASALFKAKWSSAEDDRIKECVEYFISNWLMKNSSWYKGASLRYPSTNNGIESTNSILKKEHTLRERLPLVNF